MTTRERLPNRGRCEFPDKTCHAEGDGPPRLCAGRTRSSNDRRQDEVSLDEVERISI
jgi:hypothetical protein